MQAILGLDRSFPTRLVVLKKAKNSKEYWSYEYAPNINGLICFTNSDFAIQYLNRNKHMSDVFQTIVAFNHAREIAKTTPELNGIVLLDDINDPLFHYVR